MIKKYFLLVFLFIPFVWLPSCNLNNNNGEVKKSKARLDVPFTKFNLENYRAFVIKCDLGRLKLNIRQYQFPRMEVHKTYQKYVRLEPKGDTLFIYTENTPRNTEEQRVNKMINLYLPSLDYLGSNASQIVLRDFDDRQMKILNNNNALRLYNCKIQKLDIVNEGSCNVQLDGNNYFEDLVVKLNEESYYNSQAIVLKNFVLETKSLKNTNFSNLPSDGFRWIKN